MTREQRQIRESAMIGLDARGRADFRRAERERARGRRPEARGPSGATAALEAAMTGLDAKGRAEFLRLHAARLGRG